jgi:phosphatidylglycerophosphate synthase
MGVTRVELLTWDEYSARWSTLHGGVDPRLTPPRLSAPRRSSMLIRSWLRLSYGLGRALSRTAVRPNTLTGLGVVCSLAVPVAVLLGGGWLFVAALLVLLAAVADSVDGAVAVVASRITRLGSFYDSLADRLSEAAWLLALWLLGVPGLLVVVCGALAWLHEYARARATILGMTDVGVVTVAERPTRVVLVITAFVLGGIAVSVSQRLAAGVATVVVAIWLLLGVLGAIRLFGVIRAAMARL